MLDLYDFEESGNGWKVRTLLRWLQRPFRIHWVDLLKGAQRDPAFLKKNSWGQIPVLQLESGRCLRDSNAILLSLAEGTELLPPGDDRHEVLAWLFFEQSRIDPVIGRARFRRKHPEVVPTSEEFFVAWLKEGGRGLSLLNKHLQRHRFLVGERFSIADISLYGYTHCADEGGYDLTRFEALTDWHARIRELPGVRDLRDNPEAA